MAHELAELNNSIDHSIKVHWINMCDRRRIEASGSVAASFKIHHIGSCILH